MKRTLYIAKNELYNLFFSPIAWLMMMLFLILASVDYMMMFEYYLGHYERGGYNLVYIEKLTSQIFGDPRSGVFKRVMSNLYMFFPFITMGLMSRETNNGTIKLLYSSPVKIRELVFGKYLAMLVFVLCLLVMIMFVFAAFSMSVTSPDYGQMFASMFALFLVLAAFAAIGLFLSAQTSYQLVAAMATFAVLAFFTKVGTLWQEIDAVRAVTNYLSLAGKTTNLHGGFLNLRDVVYLILISVAFIAFTIIKIKSAQESISNYKKALRYISVIIVVVIIGYITNKPSLNVYVDPTREQIFTLTPSTQEVLAKLDDGELELNIFANIFSPYFNAFTPGMRNMHVSTLWERYIRFKPDMKVNFNYYYAIDTGSYVYKNNPGKSLAEVAEKYAKSYKVNLNTLMGPEQVNQLVDTEYEEYRCFFQLKYKGQTAIIRIFDDNIVMPNEMEIAAALRRFVATPPKLLFLTDEIERTPFSNRTRDYKFISTKVGQRYALINQGFDVDTLSINTEEIPSDITALVIADPRKPFTPASLEKIKRYVDAGGNLFLAAEPDRTSVSKPLLDMLGLSLKDGILLQPSANHTADRILTYMTDSAKRLSPIFTNVLKDATKYFGDSLHRVAMIGSSIIDYSRVAGFDVVPLVVTDPVLSWNRTMPIDADSLNLKLPKLDNEEQGIFTTAIKMSRQVNNREQRIIVASDADYLTEPYLQYSDPRTYNFFFGLYSFSHFTYDEFPANTLRPQNLDTAFTITSKDVTFQKLMLYWIIPAIIGIIGAVILIRRKRK